MVYRIHCASSLLCQLFWPKYSVHVNNHMRISWCFSFLHRAGRSAWTLVCCPTVSDLTRENSSTCSSSSGSYLSSGWGAGLSSCLPFLLRSGFSRDPSPSSSGSPPHPGAPAAPCRGGGGVPPPTPEASSVGSDTFPCPFSCRINCSTRALSTKIWPSWASRYAYWRRSSSLTCSMLIS